MVMLRVWAGDLCGEGRGRCGPLVASEPSFSMSAAPTISHVQPTGYMPRPSTVTPTFHDTVDIPVTEDRSIRAVLNEDGQILLSLVRYFNLPRHQDKSMSWMTKVARSVGLLYDFSVANPTPQDVRERREFLSKFVRALISGTIRSDGIDPTGLYWQGMKWGGVSAVLGHVNNFTDFLTDEYGEEALNPMVEASFEQKVAAYRHLDIRNSNSLLKHLGNSKAAYEKAKNARQVTVKKAPRVRGGPPKTFPRHQFGRLLETGFRRMNIVDGEVWEMYNIRDMMIAILQRHGGVRSSEALQLFPADVIPAFAKHHRGAPEVRLYHPSEGHISYRALNGEQVTKTRDIYLKEAWGLTPRTSWKGDSHVGWKDPVLDFGPSEGSYALVRWMPSSAGLFFFQLYSMYIKHVLPPNLDHPFLFVNLSGEHRGRPLKRNAYYDSLSRAVRKIGLTSSKSQGTTSHGLRHAYAQDLQDAKLDPKVIMTCLHHGSMSSQETYTRPGAAQVSRVLDDAAEQLRVGSEQTFRRITAGAA